MTAHREKLLLTLIASLCLFSCETQPVDVPASGNATDNVVSDRPSETSSVVATNAYKNKIEEIDPEFRAGPELIYNREAKLTKIDRKWLVGGWYHIDPDGAFSIRERCATDNITIYADNGEIQEPIEGTKIGYWNFSNGKLTTKMYDDDGQGNLTNKLIISTSYIAKVAERVAIMIYDDGTIGSMMDC